MHTDRRKWLLTDVSGRGKLQVRILPVPTQKKEDKTMATTPTPTPPDPMAAYKAGVQKIRLLMREIENGLGGNIMDLEYHRTKSGHTMLLNMAWTTGTESESTTAAATETAT